MSRRAASPALQTARSAVDRSLDDQPDGSSVVVACSGGPDSLALAGAAAWVGARRGLSVHAIVVDHGLQQHSSTIAAHAAQQCLSLGLCGADVVEVEVGAVGGPEGAARAARYAALEDAAERLRAAVVLLGHTRDDQAETVLLRLARGSGARALSAMRARNDPWRRPFLGVSRPDVHAAATELLEPLGEAAWHDPHNIDPAFTRVRVRSLLAGLADAVGQGAVLGLARSAELLRDDADALDGQAEAEYGRVVASGEGELSADCDQLLGLPRALRTRVIRLMGLRIGCPSEEFGYDQVTQIQTLVVDWHGQGELRLPGRVEAGRTYGRLWLRSRRSTTAT